MIDVGSGGAGRGWGEDVGKYFASGANMEMIQSMRIGGAGRHPESLPTSMYFKAQKVTPEEGTDDKGLVFPC